MGSSLEIAADKRCSSSLCKVRVTSQRELLDYGHLIIKSSEPSLFKSPDEEPPGIIQENAGLEAEVQGAMPGSSKVWPNTLIGPVSWHSNHNSGRPCHAGNGQGNRPVK